MKKNKGIIWGIVLIIVALLLGAKELNILDFNIFFDGWWTLFIIIPCTIGLLTDHDKTGNLIGLLVGVFLLLGCQKVLDFDLIWKLLVPIIILIIGLSLVFKGLLNRHVNEEFIKLNKKLGEEGDIVAVFSGQELNLENEEFKGRNITAIFGGVDLDLRNSKIKEDAVINATAIFGGIDIYAPDDVNIVIKSNSIFGGAENEKKASSKEKKYTIYLNAVCIFGGIDIK